MNLLTSRWTIEGTSIVLGGYIPRKLTSESGGLLCQPESRVTAVYIMIVLLSEVIQEAPNSASSSRVSPTASTRDAFRLSRRPGFEGKTVFVASVCKTLGMPRPGMQAISLNCKLANIYLCEVDYMYEKIKKQEYHMLIVHLKELAR